MKNVLLFVMAVFVSSWATACYAGESVKAAPVDATKAPAVAPAEAPVAAPKPTEVAPASSPSTNTKDTAKAPAKATEAKGEGVSWRVVVGRVVVEFVLPILSALALLIGIPWLLKKLKMEGNKEAEDLVTALVKKAINYAESLSTSSAEKPASADKKAAAVAFVLDRAKELGLAKLTEDYVGKLIEGQLTRDKANADA